MLFRSKFCKLLERWTVGLRAVATGRRPCLRTRRRSLVSRNPSTASGLAPLILCSPYAVRDAESSTVGDYSVLDSTRVFTAATASSVWAAKEAPKEQVHLPNLLWRGSGGQDLHRCHEVGNANREMHRQVPPRYSLAMCSLRSAHLCYFDVRSSSILE